MNFFYKNIIKMHILMIVTYVGYSLLKIEKPSFIQYYGGSVFQQAWNVFSPNPEVERISLKFKCHATDKKHELIEPSRFIDKLTSQGKINTLQREVVMIVYHKEKRIKNNTMKKSDHVIYAEAKSHLDRILVNKCSKVPQEKIEFEIDYVKFI